MNASARSAACAIAVLLLLHLEDTRGEEVTGAGCRIPNTYLRVEPRSFIRVFPPNQAPSILACYEACLQEPGCHSVNYWKNDNSCTLLPVSHFAPTMYSTSRFTELVIDEDVDHFSAYACPEQQFWQVQRLSSSNILFRRHEDKCFFAYVAEVDSFNKMVAHCARFGAKSAKIVSQAQADDFRQWMGQLEEHHLTWNYTVFAGARAPNCGQGWSWHVDGTPATWWEPSTPTNNCEDAMVVNSRGFYAQWFTNPRGIICEHPCASGVVELGINASEP